MYERDCAYTVFLKEHLVVYELSMPLDYLTLPIDPWVILLLLSKDKRRTNGITLSVNIR